MRRSLRAKALKRFDFGFGRVNERPQLHSETPIDTQRKLLAWGCLTPQNLGSVSFGDTKLHMKILDPQPVRSSFHCRKFGYSEPLVKRKVRIGVNDPFPVLCQSSQMPKRRKALWKQLAGNNPGWFVSDWLLYKSLKQKDLVARTDFSKGEVSDWVNGKERWNRDVLFAFAHAIGVEPADLLRPPPIDPVDDEFSRLVVKLDSAAKRRLLRLWDAAEGDRHGGTKAA